MDELAKQMIADVKELKGLKPGTGLMGAMALLPVVIKAVETKAMVKAMTSEEKKALATAIICNLVDIPGMTKNLEASIIGRMVDTTVTTLNGTIGKKWLKKAA